MSVADRQEFSKRVKLDAWNRCKGHCEGCTAKITAANGPAEYDHIVPDAVDGANDLANCQVLCRNCHGVKTNETDIPEIAKTKRIIARNAGIKRPKRGFLGWRKMNGDIVWARDR